MRKVHDLMPSRDRSRPRPGRRRRLILIAAACGLLFGACSSGGDDTKESSPPIDAKSSDGTVAPLANPTPIEPPPADAPAFATVTLLPASGSDAAGTIIFTAVAEGLQLSIEATGLGEGSHGFHVHEFGDCSAPDASSAGGHFDPDGTKLGDLENLVTGPDGSSFIDLVAPGLTLWGETDVADRSVVIHDPDDPEIRIACGVIEAIGG